VISVFVYYSNTSVRINLHLLYHLKQLGFDHKEPNLWAIIFKTALTEHALSVHHIMRTNWLLTRRALEKNSCSQGLDLEQGAACRPPVPH